MRLSCTGTGRDGEWLRVRRHGYHLAEVRTVPARGPSTRKLHDFAGTYKRYLQGGEQRRAMTAAAAEHNISRATAHRWAATCRQLGYLPGKEEN
jgi:hypothetical protein